RQSAVVAIESCLSFKGRPIEKLLPDGVALRQLGQPLANQRVAGIEDRNVHLGAEAPVGDGIVVPLIVRADLQVGDAVRGGQVEALSSLKIATSAPAIVPPCSCFWEIDKSSLLSSALPRASSAIPR